MLNLGDEYRLRHSFVYTSVKKYPEVFCISIFGNITPLLMCLILPFAALLQLLAASEAGRDVAYFTFGDKELMHDVNRMYNFLSKKNKTVGE